jgi:hypothetical protein
MRRHSLSLLRKFEARAIFGLWVRVRAPALLGLTTQFKDFWVVLHERTPAATQGLPRVTHAQMLFFSSTQAHQPQVKLWLDGAFMERNGSGPAALFTLVCRLVAMIDQLVSAKNVGVRRTTFWHIVLPAQLKLRHVSTRQCCVSLEKIQYFDSCMCA